MSDPTPALFGFSHPADVASFNASLVWAGDGRMTDGSDATTGCGSPLSSNATFNYSSNPTWRQLVDDLRVASVTLMVQRGGCAFDAEILRPSPSPRCTSMDPPPPPC